ncbi:ABC transporter ATP-binding protein [Acanthopleuribacter pedis]
MDAFRAMLHVLRAHLSNPKLLIFGGLLMLVEATVSLSVPLLTRDFVDMTGSGTLPTTTITLLLVAMSVEAVAGAVGYFMLGTAGHGIVANMRRGLLGKLVRLPVGYFDKQQSGALASRMVNDTTTLHQIATYHIVSLLVGFLTVIGAVAILWMLDWRMTLLLFSGVLVAGLLLGPVTFVIQKISEKVMNETALFSGRLTNLFHEIRLVKSHGAEEWVDQDGNTSIEKLRRLGVKETAVQAILAPMVSLAMMGALIAILGYGGARVGAGTLEMGTLVAFILYLFHVAIPITQFSVFFSEIQHALGASKHLVAMFEEQEERHSGETQVDAQAQPLAVENLDFAYPAREEGGEPTKVLHDINLTMQPGEVTALVGASGSGKSTLLSLLLGFYETEKGRIRLGSLDLAEAQPAAWRRQTAYVSQDAPMISGSIRDNLLLGCEQPHSDEDLFRALKAAKLDGVVAEMPDGLNSDVGEQGGKLSGGQRQRLAIARAILRDAPVLILDEATSHLDTQTEYEVQSALAELMKTRTTVVVAHRLTTIQDADQIVVFDQGRIVGSGSHEQLNQSNTVYSELVAHQFKTRRQAA